MSRTLKTVTAAISLTGLLLAAGARAEAAQPKKSLFNVLYNFSGGATYAGGACNCGTVFKLAPDGTETVLHAFADGSDGTFPYYSSGLLIDKHGNLYGVTYAGGGSCNCGTIYKIDTTGHESLLHAFAGGSDGANPQTTLIADKSGNLYGTTKVAGAGGAGTVFRLAPDGTETILHAFAGNGDGANPQAGVVADKKGYIYGTTQAGGSSDAGTIFEVAPNGGDIILYNFSGGVDGDQPFTALFTGKKSELYGTASGGGKFGLGTVFEMKAVN